MISPAAPASVVNWRGRSGAIYALLPACLKSFALTPRHVHVLARGSAALWVGSDGDLVADAGNRQKFRAALEAADAVLYLELGSTPDRLTLVWDLEGGERMGALSLA